MRNVSWDLLLTRKEIQHQGILLYIASRFYRNQQAWLEYIIWKMDYSSRFLWCVFSWTTLPTQQCQTATCSTGDHSAFRLNERLVKAAPGLHGTLQRRAQSQRCLEAIMSFLRTGLGGFTSAGFLYVRHGQCWLFCCKGRQRRKQAERDRNPCSEESSKWLTCLWD